ncbi:MAG TPA: hypothetical protein VGI60_18300 [Chthoniobacterales bacterium]
MTSNIVQNFIHFDDPGAVVVPDEILSPDMHGSELVAIFSPKLVHYG